MTRIQLLCLFLLTSSMVACETAKVGYDYDPSANFSDYHTYEWAVPKQEKTGDRRADSPDVDIRIRTAVGAQLHLKGYTKPQNKQPDFYVAYHIGVNSMSLDSSTQYFSEGMTGHPFTYSADTRTMGKKQQGPVSDKPLYMTGALLIDVIDASSKKLVWRGTASGEINPGLTSEERDERIRGLVHEMFSHFPPK
ncbi:MAG TPA: DUF4136 domain-containing protein [Nitrospira sp.]|nr:DUF4136 domain-containing protein [Nitrospira sp.]